MKDVFQKFVKFDGRSDMKKFRYFLLMISPIGPVLDSHILKLSFPYITLLGYVCWIGINIPFKIRKESYFYFFLITSFNVASITFNTLLYGWVDSYAFALMLVPLCSILVLLICQYPKESYSLIKIFVYGFFLISLCIYLYRLLVLHPWDIYRVRRGASFYGGNEGHLIYLFFLFLAMEENRFSDAIFSYFLGIINALLFMSKLASGIQVVIGLYLLVKYLRIKNKKSYHMIKTIGAIILVIMLFSFSGYLDILSNRFDLYFYRIEQGASMFDTRYPLYLEALDNITSSWGAFLFGCGLGKYRFLNVHHYTNCHNLFLDVWCVFGTFGVLFWTYVFVKSLAIVRMKFLYIVILFYAIMGGNSLFFIGENNLWLWGWNYIIFMYIFINYSLKRKRYNSLMADLRND